MAGIANDKREALTALDEMQAMVLRAAPRPGQVCMERDTLLDLVRRFRGWVEAFPEPQAEPFRHTPFRPAHLRKDTPND